MLVLCWDLKNGRATARGPFENSHKVLNIRSSSSLNSRIPPELEPSSALVMSDETAVVGPFIGNVDEMATEMRRKKDCGMSSRGMLYLREMIGFSHPHHKTHNLL